MAHIREPQQRAGQARTRESSRPQPAHSETHNKKGSGEPDPSSNPTVETLSCRIDVTTAE